ncbi:MAG TPA: CtsR family transcriptional regulator [Clostridiales bacterium]|nr:CtsR family transcriptional regulator [Clostridiales bacterium]
MNMSNMIYRILLDMLEAEGIAEIQRNELAEQLGCVPSQINYVLSSRFTPEHGYIVESRRGGKGYIKITRVEATDNEIIMHLINSIGDELDESSARSHINNLVHNYIISKQYGDLLLAAVNENAYKGIPKNLRHNARAGVFKQLLLSMVDLKGGV